MLHIIIYSWSDTNHSVPRCSAGAHNIGNIQIRSPALNVSTGQAILADVPVLAIHRLITTSRQKLFIHISLGINNYTISIFYNFSVRYN